jgi:hypothetical protein
MPLTYQKLKDALNELTPEQLNMQVSIIQILEDNECSLNNIHDCMTADEIESNLNIELDEYDIEPTLPLLILPQISS